MILIMMKYLMETKMKRFILIKGIKITTPDILMDTNMGTHMDTVADNMVNMKVIDVKTAKIIIMEIMVIIMIMVEVKEDVTVTEKVAKIYR